MKYSDLNLKINTKTKLVKIGDFEIEVSEYLPMRDKIDLVQIALQKAEENGTYNDMKLDMYFNLYIIYMYTNLEFTDEEKEDEFTLYDELQSNDIIISVIGTMEEYEYDTLLEYLNVMKDTNMEYNLSAASLFKTFIQDMPKNAAAAAEIINSFDADKYKEVAGFAEAANAGRPIAITPVTED